jgi:oligogalacturonide lyase
VKVFGASIIAARFRHLLAFVAVVSMFGCPAIVSPILAQDTSLPKTWVDPDTGRRVTRLTDIPGSRGLYFNYRAHSPDGRTVIYLAKGSIYTFEHNSGHSALLVTGPVSWAVVGPKTGIVFYTKPHDLHLYTANPTTGELRALFELPTKALPHTINSDETLLAGTYTEGSTPDVDAMKLPDNVRPSRAAISETRVRARIPMVLFTSDLASGKTNVILRGTDWLNHVEFSPTEPTLLMYCHEGIWQRVDRIWTIRADGTENHLVHQRTMVGEVAGHEFWGPDGKTIWFDLQKPKGKNFYLASYNAISGEHKEFRLSRNQWSTHFNISPDGKWAAGDGGDSFQVANAPDGQWIELFRLPGGKDATDAAHVPLASEHLVNMHQYKYDRNVEPNVRFSPDSKQILFNSKMNGDTYMFAVDVTAEVKQNANTSSRKALRDEPGDEPTELMILNEQGNAISGAVVTVSSLDGQGEIGKFQTDATGKTEKFVADQGLYRIQVVCPNSACLPKVTEKFSWQLIGPVSVAVKSKGSSVTPNELSPTETLLQLRDQNGKPLNDIQVLVRTEDASKEKWYRSNGSGDLRVRFATDPSILLILFERSPLEYRVEKSCTEDQTVDPVSKTRCIALQSTITLSLSDSGYRDKVVNRDDGSE